MLALANLPVWLVYAMVGAVLGGAGAAFSSYITRNSDKKWVRYLIMIVFFAISPIITKEIIIHQVNIAYLTDIANRDLPKMVDDVTKLNRITFKRKTIHYDFSVDNTVPDDINIQNIKAINLRDICSNFMVSFLNNELEYVEYRYIHHEKLKSFTLFHDECVKP